MSLSASLANSSGRYSQARPARCASALARVSMSTKSGSRCKKLRITATWPAPRSPLRCASAVAGNTGGNGSPFNARRSPRSAASWIRREASARLIRNRLANAGASLPPNSVGIGLLGELIDQGVFDGGLSAPHLLKVFQHGQPFGRGQHVERQVPRAFVSSLERVENLDDLFTTTRTHVRMIASRSDNAQKVIHRRNQSDASDFRRRD